MTNPDVTALAAGNGRRQFFVQIDGLEVRYWTDIRPASGTLSVAGTAGAIRYKERTAVVGLSPTSASYDLAGGIADHAAMTIELAVVDPDDPWDAVNVFGRCGSKSASFATQVLETIPSSAAGVTLDIEDDATGLTFPCLVYVGDECMKATAATAAPNTITVTRAAANTLAQRHVCDLNLGDAPLLTREPVFFRGRTVTVYCFDAPGIGTPDNLPTSIEIYRGFLAEAPEVDSESLRVTLTVQPMTARLDTPLGSVGVVRTGLVHGFHYFSDEKAQTICHVQHLGPAPGPSYRVNSTVVAGRGFLTVGTSGATLHSACFQVPTGATPQLAVGHPRSGMVYGWDAAPMSVTAYSSLTGFTVDTAYPLLQFPQFTGIYDAPAAELHRLDVVPFGGATCAAWPDVVLEAVNTRAGWLPGQGGLDPAWHTDDGQWVDVQLVLDGPDGPHLACQSNVARPVSVAVWGKPRALAPGLQAPADVPLGLIRDAKWWGRRQRAPNDQYAVNVGRPSEGAALWYGLSFSNPVNGTVENHVRSASVPPVTDRARTLIPIVGAARGFYQRRERYILVKDDLPIGTDGTRIRIEYTDIYDGERKSALATVTASTAVTNANGTTIGYRLTVDQDGNNWDVPSFGDWVGIPNGDGDPISTEPVEIYTVAEFDGSVSPGEIILQLLTSVAGAGANGNYDVLPWGAGIDDSDIDTRSILGFAYPPQLSSWRFRVPNGTTVAKVIEPMLRVFGAVLGMRTDDNGVCRLTMFPLGMETSVESVEALNADAFVEGFQSWGVDDEVRNVFRFRYDFNDEGKPRSEVEIRDQRSLRNYGGERRELVFDLPGLRAAARNRFEWESLFRDVWSRMSAQLGQARRLWRGRVHSGATLRAGLGSVVAVTSPWLKGYGTGLGVTGAYARVRRIKVDWWGEGGELELVHYDTLGTGWNAALNVTAVPGATTLTVSQNAYSDIANPHTGLSQEDLTGFEVGDVVFALPKGNEDARTKVTITRLNRTTNQIGVTPAHGIVAGVLGYVVPATYDLASATHQALAYLADAGGTLGSAGTPGFVFV